MGKQWGSSIVRVLAASIALCLAACGGGGGGSNVRPTPPPSAPAEHPTASIGENDTLIVSAGESVTKPLLIFPGGVLINAGKIGGAGFEYAVASGNSYGRNTVVNHEGGTIVGGDYGLKLWNFNATVENTGVGTLIRADGIAVEVLDEEAKVVNAEGATISGGRIGVSLPNGGSLVNGAGSTIEARDTTEGDCFEVGACAVYILPEQYAGIDHSLKLDNAGTIIGDVRLDPSARNVVTLWAGSLIQGDLLIDSDSEFSWSSLVLDGAAGTTQLYSQAVTGTTSLHGGLVKNGEGTWILDNDALGRGRTSDEEDHGASISAGTLQIGNGGSEGPDSMGSVTAASGARLVFNRSDDYVFNASFRGEGTLVQAGTGLLTLQVPGNIIDGWIGIEAGKRLQFENNADDGRVRSIGASIANDGTLVFAGENGLHVQGGISGAGSLTMDGASSLVLLGENSYSGGTIVNSGALSASQGLPGDVVVNQGGTLRGGPVSNSLWYVNGLPQVAGSVSNSGRVVMGLGGTQVGGDYLQSTTGTLAIRLGSQMDVAGTATLEGGTLEVVWAEDGYIANAHTEVLTAAGGVIGAFDQLVKGPGLVFTSNTIHYDANSVWLDTTGLDITSAAAGAGIGYTEASMSSAQRLQGAFEQLNERIETGTLAGVPGGFLQSAGQFQRAASIEAAQASLRSLSGELHAAGAAMAFRAIDAGNLAWSARMNGLRRAGAGTGMWSRQLGSDGSLARSGFDEVAVQLAGWLVGSDFALGRAGVAGFAFGQGIGRQQLRRGMARDDSRNTEGMVYAGLAGDHWYAQGRIGFGHSSQYVDRRLLLGNAAESVWTRYDGHYQVVHGESGLRLAVAETHIAPFISLEYARSARDGFAEQGAGGFGLRSDAQSLARWRSAIGMRAAHEWNLGGGRALGVQAHAQWHRSLGSPAADADASFVGLELWSPMSGIGLSRYGSLFGVGLETRLSPGTSLKLAYDYDNSQYYSAHALFAGLTMAF